MNPTESLVSAYLQSEHQKPLILVVDDVPDNIQFLAARLRGKGFQVSAASSGADALRNIEAKLPDLILLDVQMPEMDGFEVCRRLKDNPITTGIPVIFLTARTELEDIVEGLSLGAVDYVTKPFHASELMTRVRTHLELKYARDLLVERNSQLATLNEQLIQLNNEKNEFLGVAAHDLKNPLGAVRWLAELLLNDNSNLSREREHEVLRNIIGSSERMFSIVTNLLDVNAIEQGTVNLEPEPVNLLIAVADVVANFEERARQKNITLHINNEISATNAGIFVNPNILSQVLENLVSNAIKYSPNDKNIWVVVKEQPTDTKEKNSALKPTPCCLILVKDEGPGISEDDKKRLYGKFARLTAQPTGGEHSTGLGLFIVKKLVEAMHGRVWCESEVGNGIAGATFIVEFPKTL